MKITIAIDSLKGSLTSLEAGEAIREGIHRALPEAEVRVRPLADGGEGTVEALTIGMGGVRRTVTVTGPLGSPVACVYGIVTEGDRKTAILEMSGAAGITLVPEGQRDPMKTTTYGVGEVIRDAIGQGCREFIVGIGGSATNDGGIGMLQALGYEFLDSDGAPVPCGGEGLMALRSIDVRHAMPELEDCRFRVACDVTNPLCGDSGCSAVYGPQKGANPEMIRTMDQALAVYAARTSEALAVPADPDHPGSGAAGGMGFAFRNYLKGELESGIQIVLSATKLEDFVRDSDLVVTGEGCLDGQTVMGKAPIGVAKIAKQYGIPVIAFSGAVKKDADACNREGIDAFFPILRRPATLEEAMDPRNAGENMRDTAEQVFRLIAATEIGRWRNQG